MSDDPTITQVEGVKTTLPAEDVADLMPKASEAAPEAKTEEVKPAEPKAEEPKSEPEAPSKPADEQPKEPEAPKAKAKPIAKLLEKNHELETQLEAEKKA